MGQYVKVSVVAECRYGRLRDFEIFACGLRNVEDFSVRIPHENMEVERIRFVVGAHVEIVPLCRFEFALQHQRVCARQRKQVPGHYLNVIAYFRNRAVFGFDARKNDGRDVAVFVYLEQSDFRLVGLRPGGSAGQRKVLRIVEFQFLHFDDFGAAARPLVAVSASRRKHGDAD